MSTTNNRPVTTGQIREILCRRRDNRAARVRFGLIGLLAEQTKIPNLPELPIGELVGEMLALEKAKGPLGEVVQNIIAPPRIEEPEAHGIARRIMGENFLGLPEVAQVFGLVSQALQDVLATIPFDEETLWICRKTHVPVADIGLSIIDVRECVKRGAFYSNEDAWFNTYEFAKRTEGVAWRLIRKTPVPNSVEKNLGDQKALIGEQDDVPTARQVVYAIILTFVTTGERLFERIHVRTISLDSDGDRVFVGQFDSTGLYISVCGDHDCCVSIGLSSCRKA
jgi:hypothetical protein